MARHPYYPKSLYLPGYVPNEMESTQILITFFGIVGIIIALSFAYASRQALTRTLGSRLTVTWFTTCFFIHTFFEGYYVVTQPTLAADLSLFGQAWKEYAMADSRYLSGDAAVWIIEAFTCFLWGPLSLVILISTYTSDKSSTLAAIRYPLTFTVSFGQLYGCLAYYATSILTNFEDVHPHPQYFFGYFVGCNAPWVIIPSMLMWQSWKQMVRALKAAPAAKKVK